MVQRNGVEASPPQIQNAMIQVPEGRQPMSQFGWWLNAMGKDVEDAYEVRRLCLSYRLKLYGQCPRHSSTATVDG